MTRHLIHPALKEARSLRPAEAPLVSQRRLLSAKKVIAQDVSLHPFFSDDEDFAIARRRMVEEQIIARGVSQQRVLEAIGRVPRHVFVDDALKKQAYIDAPLAIGGGQTISQPYIVALMSQALTLDGSEHVLEIGTGCGYQTTVLAQLAKKVYTIERSRVLGLFARSILRRFRLTNVVMRIGDGSRGWEEYGPFDAILAACVAPQVPQVLLDQLAEGGRLVMPVGSESGDQNLIRITRTSSGLKREDLGSCRFVPMLGRYGFG